jgi:mannose-6-phosphate isomerase-like protein (cupin superfamily)
VRKVYQSGDEVFSGDDEARSRDRPGACDDPARQQGGSVTGFTVAQLHDIPRRNSTIPIRRHLDIGAFGVNAYRGDDAGSAVISDHVETLTGHEELYVVVEGHATFTVDGEDVDAPAGTFVFVGDPATRRSAVAKEPGTTVLVVGAPPGHAFEVGPWEEAQEAMGFYREERYGEAADVLRRALEQHPDNASLHYNLACFDCRAGADAATVAAGLKRAIELYPGFGDFARDDADFDRVREEAAFRAAVG